MKYVFNKESGEISFDSDINSLKSIDIVTLFLIDRNIVDGFLSFTFERALDFMYGLDENKIKGVISPLLFLSKGKTWSIDIRFLVESFALYIKKEYGLDRVKDMYELTNYGIFKDGDETFIRHFIVSMLEHKHSIVTMNQYEVYAKRGYKINARAKFYSKKVVEYISSNGGSKLAVCNFIEIKNDKISSIVDNELIGLILDLQSDLSQNISDVSYTEYAKDIAEKNKIEYVYFYNLADFDKYAMVYGS